MVPSRSPVRTACPGCTSTRIITPIIGARTVPWAAAALPAAASCSGRISSARSPSSMAAVAGAHSTRARTRRLQPSTVTLPGAVCTRSTASSTRTASAPSGIAPKPMRHCLSSAAATWVSAGSSACGPRRRRQPVRAPSPQAPAAGCATRRACSHSAASAATRSAGTSRPGRSASQPSMNSVLTALRCTSASVSSSSRKARLLVTPSSVVCASAARSRCSAAGRSGAWAISLATIGS